MDKINVISLFCGCGGMDLGLTGGFSYLGKKYTKHPFKIVYAVDNDPYCSQIYNANFSHKCEVKDVRDINIKDIPDFDLLIGGFPCQSFSISAQNPPRLGYKDERGMLFFEMVKILKAHKPRFFIAENVKGLLSANKKKAFPMIIKEFEEAGYLIKYSLLNAYNYGVPQKRERVVLIGMLNTDFDIDVMFEEVKKQININNPHFFEPVSVWEAISDIETPTESGITTLLEPTTSYQKSLRCGCTVTTNHIATEHNKRSCKRMKQIHEGENWVKLNEPIHSVHSGAYGRLEKDKPAATITTRFDTPSGGRFIHPVADRTITLREAARLQSFPDNFEFVGTKSSVCKQIGNAVPPKLSYFLANLVKYALYENN